MGLFDGIEAGWNSFKNNELKTVTDVVTSPNPIVKLLTNPEKVANDPSYLLPEGVNVLGNKGPVDQWNDVKDVLVSPNPVIQAVTGNGGDIGADKTSTEKWDNVVTSTVGGGGEKVKEAVKDTVNNITQGVGGALPYLAIGGAALLVATLLFGRR